MGSEAVCRVRFEGQSAEGKALLETTELIFRSDDLRLRIPLRDIASLNVDDGFLEVGFSKGAAVFELGKDAATWAHKIRNPRGLMDKLGVKAGQTVVVLGVSDEDFLSDLKDRAGVKEDRPNAGADWLFYEADHPDDLVRLPELVPSIKRSGAIWVVSPKGKTAQIRDTDVMAAARDAGLVDTKVVSFSDTHTALKLVIPVARR